jgi:hypothetical protein
MGRIRIKNMEGKEEDLRNLLQKSGCSLTDVLKIKKRKKVSAIWLWMLVFAFFTLACCVWNDIFAPGWQKVAILGLCLLPFVLIFLVHFNYRNWSLTTIAGLGTLVIVAIALNVCTPKEITGKVVKGAEKRLGQ